MLSFPVPFLNALYNTIDSSIQQVWTGLDLQKEYKKITQEKATAVATKSLLDHIRQYTLYMPFSDSSKRKNELLSKDSLSREIDFLYEVTKTLNRDYIPNIFKKIEICLKSIQNLWPEEKQQLFAEKQLEINHIVNSLCAFIHYNTMTLSCGNFAIFLSFALMFPIVDKQYDYAIKKAISQLSVSCQRLSKIELLHIVRALAAKGADTAEKQSLVQNLAECATTIVSHSMGSPWWN